MRRLRLLAAAIVVPTVLIGTAACTDAGDGSAAEGPGDGGPPSSPAPSPMTPAELAGGAEAEALAPLPEGAATGTAVLTYSGVGELREPFTGSCSHDGDATRIEGSADTARIRLDVAPDGAEVRLDDAGLSATSDLTTGRYDVEGGHLSLSADLAQDRQTIGSIELEIDCG